MNRKTCNVLFLCTGNSARSILAEAILNREGGGRFRAFSAGSQPKGKPHPMAIELLKSLNYETEGLRSKSWEEFAAPEAPKMDFIFTVCDNAAGEACPVWPGHPASAHWGIADPAAAEGSREDVRRAFVTAHRQLSERIAAFLALQMEKLDPAGLKAALQSIGRFEGATSPLGADQPHST